MGTKANFYTRQRTVYYGVSGSLPSTVTEGTHNFPNAFFLLQSPSLVSAKIGNEELVTMEKDLVGMRSLLPAFIRSRSFERDWILLRLKKIWTRRGEWDRQNGAIGILARSRLGSKVTKECMIKTKATHVCHDDRGFCGSKRGGVRTSSRTFLEELQRPVFGDIE